MNPRTQATPSSTPIVHIDFKSYRELLTAANELVETKQFTTALAKYQEAQDLFDYLPDAYLGSARVLVILKEKDKAINFYRSVLAHNPEHLTAIKELIKLLLTTDKDAAKVELDKAKKLQEKFLRLRKDYFVDLTADLNKFLAGKRKEDFLEAYDCLEKISRGGDEQISSAMEESYFGYLALKKQHIYKAVYHLQRAKEKFKFDFYSQNTLSHIYLKYLGDSKAAQLALLFALDYSHPIANLYMGLIFAAEKNYPTSKIYFSKAFKLAEIHHFEAFEKERLVEILLVLNDLQKISIPTTEEQLKINKELKSIPEVSLDLKEEKYFNRIRVLKRLLAQDIGNIKIYEKRAKYYIFLDAIEEAINDLTSAALIAFHAGDIIYAQAKLQERNRLMAKENGASQDNRLNFNANDIEPSPPLSSIAAYGVKDIVKICDLMSLYFPNEPSELESLIQTCSQLMEKIYHPPLYLLRALLFKKMKEKHFAIFDFNIFAVCAENEIFSRAVVRRDILIYLKIDITKTPNTATLIQVQNKQIAYAEYFKKKYYFLAKKTIKESIKLAPDLDYLYATAGALEEVLGFDDAALRYYAQALTLAYEKKHTQDIIEYTDLRAKLMSQISLGKSYIDKVKNSAIELKKFLEWYEFQFPIYANEIIHSAGEEPILEKNSSLAMFLGYEIFLSNQFYIAIDLFTEALGHSPDNFIAKTLRGMCYLQLKEFAAAEADFKSVVDTWNYPLATAFGAEILFKQNKVDAAKFLYQIAIKRLNDYALQLFKPTPAVVALVTESEPLATAQDYFIQGLALKSQDPEKAKLLFSLSALLNDTESHWEAYWERSLCHLLTENPNAALSDFMICLNITLGQNDAVEKLIAERQVIWVNLCLDLGSELLSKDKNDLAYMMLSVGYQIEKSKKLQEKMQEANKKIYQAKKSQHQFKKTQARKKQRARIIYAGTTNEIDFATILPASSPKKPNKKPASETVITPKKFKLPKIKIQPKYKTRDDYELSILSDEAILEIANTKEILDPQELAAAEGRKEKHKQNRINKEKRKLMQELARQEILAKESNIPDETDSSISDEIPSDSDDDIASEESCSIHVETDDFNTLFPSNAVIPLTEHEKSLLAKFATLTTADGGQYTTLLVGGSVFDRALNLFFTKLVAKLKANPDDELLKEYLTNPIFKRVRQGLFYDDLDSVTEVPLAHVKAIATELGWEAVNQFNADVASFSVRGIKIDILHKEKISVIEEMQQRIFCQFFATSEGELLDPSNRALIDLIHSQLTTLKPFAEAYTDPFACFIALRQHIKRCLLIPAPQEMYPVLLQIAENLQQQQNGFTLGNANAYLKKIFHCNPYKLIETYRILQSYEIFSLLFSPTLANVIKEYDNWVIEQLEELNNELRPALHKLYSVFIVAVVMQEIGRDLYLKAMNLNGFIASEHTKIFLESYRANGTLLQRCESVIANYPLFTEAFAKKTKQDYHQHLQQCIDAWFQQVYFIANTPSVSIVKTPASFFHQHHEHPQLEPQKKEHPSVPLMFN